MEGQVDSPELGSPIPSMVEYRESRERITDFRFEIGVNKAVLEQMRKEYPHFETMLETFARLPSTIDLQKGSNWIFGENGSGKSTLANVFQMLVEIGVTKQRKEEEAVLKQDSQAFSHAEVDAYEQILMNPWNQAKLAKLYLSGLSAELVARKAFSLTNFDVPSGSFVAIDNIDVQNIIGEIKDIGDVDGIETLSGRQEIERRLENGLSDLQRPSSLKRIGILFIDELDYGLSPWREESFMRGFQDRISEAGEVILVLPANSVFAYSQPYRRIDLSQPDRGYFIPKEDEVRVLSREGEPVLSSEIVDSTVNPEIEVDLKRLNHLKNELSDPRLVKVLDIFSQFPMNMKFEKGVTLIFGDNGAGKTTLLKTLYLLYAINHHIISRDLYSDRLMMSDRIKNSYGVILDMDNISREGGLAPKLVERGAISLGEEMGKLESFDNPVYLDMLSLAGSRVSEVEGALRLVGSRSNNIERVLYREDTEEPWVPASVDPAVREEILAEHRLELKKKREVEQQAIASGRDAISYTHPQLELLNRYQKALKPDFIARSTRLSAEAELSKVVETIAPGSLLFVDELEAGISPQGQLNRLPEFYQQIKDKGIFLIATSNSYYGYYQRSTPIIDLRRPELGIIRS